MNMLQNVRSISEDFSISPSFHIKHMLIVKYIFFMINTIFIFSSKRKNYSKGQKFFVKNLKQHALTKNVMSLYPYLQLLLRALNRTNLSIYP